MWRPWTESGSVICLSILPSDFLTLCVFSRIVASLVRAQTIPFLLNITRWLLVAIPATWTNSWLSYVQNKLAIAYRTRLTEEVLKEYLGDGDEDVKDKVYYKLCEYCYFATSAS